jgi:aldehyde:ferredoxin oxidoreductase
MAFSAGGYSGKLLRVNLTDRKVIVEDLDPAFCRQYLGGSGFIGYYLLKELQPGTDPLGPTNKLIFASGPVTGTSLIASGRNAIGAKSPLSNGIALSQVGEYWGAELKRAGYDVIIVEGKADRPVYLWISADAVQIKDACHIWGHMTKETQQMIRTELGDDRIRVAMIGPGGESLIPYACIMNGLYDAAGRGGLGAVMGSKNLKAVAVRGHTQPTVANTDRVKEINRWFAEIMNAIPILKGWHEAGTGFDMDAYDATGDLAVRNWHGGPFPQAKNINGYAIKRTYGVGMEGCYACPMRCKKKVRVDSPYVVDPAYGGPEYESMGSFGSNCGVDDLPAILKANELCNAYGIDVISTGGVISFAMECFETGLLTSLDTGGIELRFGNSAAMLKCVDLIARLEGFGKILAEGTARLSKKIGGQSPEFAMHVKGVDPGQHEPRLSSSMGLGFMINPHGADHCCNVIDTRFSTEAGMKGVSYLGMSTEPFPLGDIGPRKVALFRMEHQRQVLYDCLVVCHLAAAGVNFEKLTEVLEAVTGWHTSIVELMTIADRAMTLARLFNVREGFTADDDKLPGRYFQPRPGSVINLPGLDPDKMDKAKRYYYTLMGWDPETGVPLPEKLAELGIPFRK